MVVKSYEKSAADTPEEKRLPVRVERETTPPPAGSGTFRVAAEAEESTRLELLARFKADTTAVLVHDMKGPLSAVLMNLEFALQELADKGVTTGARAALLESRAAGRSLLRMMANLLDIAKNDDGRLLMRRVDTPVEVLFDRVLGEYEGDANALDVRLTATAPPELRVVVDVELMARVLTTLVDGSLRHTDPGGSIVLDASRSVKGAIVLTVTTHGAPVPDEAAQALSGGSRGLGVYFCRIAVEGHGGTIRLSSHAPSRMMMFHIELPG